VGIRWITDRGRPGKKKGAIYISFSREGQRRERGIGVVRKIFLYILYPPIKKKSLRAL